MIMRIVVAATLISLLWANDVTACDDRQIDETGWIPVNDRSLLVDARLILHSKRTQDAIRDVGAPMIRRTNDRRPVAGWVYGERKKVVTTDCGVTDTKFFFEAFLLFMQSRDEKIEKCWILRRTIVSEDEQIDPMQDEGLLPFTVENKSCRRWLRILDR